MRRAAIVIVGTLLVMVVFLGAGLVIWQIRALRTPEAEYLISTGLAHSSGFSGAQIERVASGWSTARAGARLHFGIRGFRTNRVSVDVDFVRVDGSWRVLGVHAGGRQYPTLEDLAHQEMADLRAEQAQHVAEVTAQTARTAGEIAFELGQEMADTLAEGWRQLTD